VSLPQLLATPSGIVTVVCERPPELGHAFLFQVYLSLHLRLL
jgi:hypothetical protein